MKTDFSKFQLSKASMNALRGGNQRCHCETGGKTYVLKVEDKDFFLLDEMMTTICGDNIGWACSPIK